MNTIEVNGVRKTYRVKASEPGLRKALRGLFSSAWQSVEAVRDLSFAVPQGQIVGLLGVNGAGKTTLIKLISGILRPDGGSIRVLGYDPFEKKDAYKRQVALILGNKNQLLWDLPPKDSFLVTASIYDLPKALYQQRLALLSELFQIEAFATTPVRNLSLGQRMRCELVGALLHRPGVILLDEPTLGLDIQSQQILRAYVKHYVQETGATCIITSHNLRDIIDMVERILVIHQGKKIEDSLMTDFAAAHRIEEGLLVTVPAPIAAEPLRASFPALQIEADPQGARIRVGKAELPALLQLLYRQVPPQEVTLTEPTLEHMLENYLRNL